MSINDIFTEEYINKSISGLMKKPDSHGIDGIKARDFVEWFNLNKVEFMEDVKTNGYTSDPVKSIEMLKVNGKRRKVNLLTAKDRFLENLVLSYLEDKVELYKNSFAFQKNKAVKDAITLIKNFISADNYFMLEVDVENYFDNIDLDLLSEFIYDNVDDDDVHRLIIALVKHIIYDNDEVCENNKGIIQGSTLSPILSNIFLNKFDYLMGSKNYKYLRYCDNLYFFTCKKEEAEKIFEEVKKEFKKYKLPINKNKSGIFNIFNRKILGYHFIIKNGNVFAEKNTKKDVKIYNEWNISAPEYKNNEYYIVSDGILTNKDYSLIFENDELKNKFPVKGIEYINIYSNVYFGSNFFNLMSKNNISINIFDIYGNHIGTYFPHGYHKDVRIMLKQAFTYNNYCTRLALAKKIIYAGLFNARVNLLYYANRLNNINIKNIAMEIKHNIDIFDTVYSIGNLLLTEARCRSLYYSCFDQIIKNKDFNFIKRTKCPPRNKVNALISFGNTVLYTYISNMINKAGMDTRIAYLHSSIGRRDSLSLDIAEIFKPIIIDRTIFMLINKGLLTRQHFMDNGNSVLLNKAGKKIFLNAIREKLNVEITINNKKITYSKVIMENIKGLKDAILNNKQFNPFKYN